MIQKTVPPETILSQAQEGNPEAIAILINQVLSKKGITSTATVEGSCLQLTLTSEQIFSPSGCVNFIDRGMTRLGAKSITSVRVIGQQPNKTIPAWIEKFDLQPANAVANITPVAISPPEVVPKPKPQKPKRQKPNYGFFWFAAIVSILNVILAVAVYRELENPEILKPTKPAITQPIKSKAKKPATKPRTNPKAKPTKSGKSASKMQLEKVIAGGISPKSVVHSGNGLFFAQNMMYSHTITVYNRQHKLVKTIPDNVNLAKFGYVKLNGNYRGAPVEASFSHHGKYAWVSNYQMYGKGFNNPGNDRCSPSPKLDRSFLYRINTQSLQIEKAIQVGSVPKFVAATPDNRLVLVSNWCSWDLSIVDTNKNKEFHRIKLGAYPRGIAVDAKAEKAYVAVMGSSNIAQVDLKNYSVKWLKNVGQAPRHINIDPKGKFLYASLNNEGRIAKIGLPKGNVISKVYTGSAPRSMILSQDGERLYVVNYSSNTVSKVRTKDMKVLQTVRVAPSPIGITYDPQKREVWVACYSGQIMVFQD